MVPFFPSLSFFILILKKKCKWPEDLVWAKQGPNLYLNSQNRLPLLHKVSHWKHPFCSKENFKHNKNNRDLSVQRAVHTSVGTRNRRDSESSRAAVWAVSLNLLNTEGRQRKHCDWLARKDPSQRLVGGLWLVNSLVSFYCLWWALVCLHGNKLLEAASA